MTEGRNELARQEGSRHITREQFCDWLAGEMPPARETGFLGHIGSCTFCAGQFAGWMEALPGLSAQQMGHTQEFPVGNLERTDEFPVGKQKLPQPPAYLKEEILQRTQQMGMQVSVHVKERSRQMQLFMYSLKVGLAVMSSIFLLMMTTGIQEQQPGIRSWKTEQMQQKQDLEPDEKEPGITRILNQKSGEVSSFLNDISNGLFRIGIEVTE